VGFVFTDVVLTQRYERKKVEKGGEISAMVFDSVWTLITPKFYEQLKKRSVGYYVS
ncbi:hypothetical protein GWI33_022238, partial [Rhynchophorus ferrugineus]